MSTKSNSIRLALMLLPLLALLPGCSTVSSSSPPAPVVVAPQAVIPPLPQSARQPPELATSLDSVSALLRSFETLLGSDSSPGSSANAGTTR